MKKFLTDRIILIRKITVVLLILGLLPFVGFGIVKANEYRQSQIILQEAKQLSSEGKYQEAIGKLTLAENKWSPSGTKEEIRFAIEDNKQLIGSSKNYELGKEIFNKGNYKDALELLKKVDSRNINYSSARSLIELADKKLAEAPKGEVAGVKTEVKKVAQSAPQALPEPTPSSTPTPTVTPPIQKTQHTDSYCKNEAAMAVIKLDEDLSRITREESPWLFSYEAYLKQFPNAEIGYDAWQQFAQQTYEGYKQYAVREGQKLYLKVYNQCLGN